MKWEKQIVLVHLAHLMNALSVHLVWKQSSAPTCPKRNSEGVKNDMPALKKADKARKICAKQGRGVLESRHEAIKRDLRNDLAMHVAQSENLREEIRLVTEDRDNISDEIARKSSQIVNLQREIELVSDRLGQKQKASVLIDEKVSGLRTENSQLKVQLKTVESELLELKKRQTAIIRANIQAFDTVQRKKMEQLERKLAELVAISPTGGSSLKDYCKGNKRDTTNVRCQKALECLKRSVVKWKLSDGFLKEFKAFLTEKLGFDVFVSRQKIDQLKKENSATENYHFTAKTILKKVGSREVEVETVHIEAKDLKALISRRLRQQYEGGTLTLKPGEPIVCGVGGDKGGSTTKLVVVFGNLINPNNPLGILLIGSYEGNDDYMSLKTNFGPLFHALNDLKNITYQENGVEVTRNVLQFPVGDCKFLSAILGHPGQSSSTPCFLCKLSWVNRGQNAATLGTFDFGAIGDSWHPDDLKTPLLHTSPDCICPPPLHILLGVIQDYVVNWCYAICNITDFGEPLPESLKEQRKSLKNLMDQEEFYSTRYLSSKHSLEIVDKMLAVLERTISTGKESKESPSSCNSAYCFVSNATKKDAIPKCDMVRCSQCNQFFHGLCIGVITEEDSENAQRNPGKCMECRKGRQVPILERKKLTEKAHHDISKRLNSDEEVLEDIVEEREKLENTVDKLSGPTRKKLEHVLRSIKCDSRAFFQQLTGNQARKILRPENIAKIHEVFPTNASDNLELMRDVMMDLADLM
uniref:Zinc finger PHD-type domain-containing protein n=2 Tax=Caenorhabditis japonica TaxID=281687 RepID=A0A8R1DUE8_CAEJA